MYSLDHFQILGKILDICLISQYVALILYFIHILYFVVYLSVYLKKLANFECKAAGRLCTTKCYGSNPCVINNNKI